MDCGIYKITNIKNGKAYIGQTKNFNRRINEHKTCLKHNRHSNKYMQNAYNKCGINQFKFEMIFLCNIQDLNDAEMFFISKLNTRNKSCGYNLNGGGDSKGINHPLYGKKMSKETKQKISYSLIGRKIDKSLLQKWSDCKKGLKLGNASIEHRKHLSEACKGRIINNETRLKISKANTGKKKSKYHSILVNQYDINNNLLMTWDSLFIASNELNIRKSSLRQCLNGVYKTAGGFIWKFT